MPTITLVGGGRTGTALWQGRIGHVHQIEIEVVEPTPTPALIDICHQHALPVRTSRSLFGNHGACSCHQAAIRCCDVTLDFSRPGKPTDNAYIYIEPFNGTPTLRAPRFEEPRSGRWSMLEQQSHLLEAQRRCTFELG